MAGKPVELKIMISEVVQKNGSFTVYDEDGKRIGSTVAGSKELVGVAGEFFVVYSYTDIVTYNEKCNKIASMIKGGKKVTGAAGKTFTVKNGASTETYDKKCKKISSRIG